ncbi:hypothetical protein B9T25_05010 [Acinetobacter sp. ANC 4470]|uniref:hypothetical protein n=1 Tax=Acinetobacter sp. ANC 4470 TaxID=1977881 RepID=UPI000A32FF12|nr:hypothetical protein [Acinetobacter sp. ANC 4470]OTG68847.1 hypothetical protein B9T25_05010 [Acinetobacter sp. ANC 4470]
MINPDQQEMFDVLEKQQQHQRQVDRVLKIVLPIVAFLIATICANMNIASPIGTLIILIIAFWMVSIKRQNLRLWLVVIFVYCLIDNYLSYGAFHLPSFSRQFGTMFTFVGIFGIGRPYIDRWLIKN